MKKFVIKIGVLFLTIFILQIALYFAEGGSKHTYSKKIKSVYSVIQSRPDIIYFGDSVVTSYSNSDSNKKTLPEMLGDILKNEAPCTDVTSGRGIKRNSAEATPFIHRRNVGGILAKANKKVGAVENAAYHSEVFYAVCRYMVSIKIIPEAIVIPINLRSFSPEWDMKPGYQFVEDIAFFKYDSMLFRSFYKPLAVFKVIDLAPVSEAEYRQTPVYDGDTVVGKVKDFDDKKRYEKYSDENMKNKLIFFYMYKLSPEHRKVKALVSMANSLKGTSVTAVFYLTPVDYETGDKFMGPRFSRRISENTGLIVSLLRAAGADVLDLSRSLPSGSFDMSGRQYCNEHLNEKGRKFVAEQVAGRIKLLSAK